MVTFSEVPAPDLGGKLVVVTGASSGIGLEATRYFLDRGADVVMGCRNVAKATALFDDLRKTAVGKVSVIRVDTSDLQSVRQFARDFAAAGYTALDRLVLNAGIMAVPWDTVPTASAEHPTCELQMATNHLGHFLLTQLLLPTVVETPGARVIAVSSVAASMSPKIDYDVVLAKTPAKYQPWTSYGNSKLANLLFIQELGRRLSAAGVDTLALACHPGYAATNLQSTFDTTFMGKLERMLVRPLVSHSIVDGSRPTVLAAIDPTPGLSSGTFYGPLKMMGMKGEATSSAPWPKLAMDTEAQAELWRISEELAGVKSAI